MFEGFDSGSRRFQVRDPLVNLVGRILNDSGRVAESSHLTDATDERSWLPPVDIYETDKAFVVTVDLPGLAREDIEVAIEEDMLTVSGERNPLDDEHLTFRRVERAYGSFRRSFTLPKGIEAGKIEAKLSDGVLRLRLPKAELVQSRKINVG